MPIVRSSIPAAATAHKRTGHEPGASFKRPVAKELSVTKAESGEFAGEITHHEIDQGHGTGRKLV